MFNRLLAFAFADGRGVEKLGGGVFHSSNLTETVVLYFEAPADG